MTRERGPGATQRDVPCLETAPVPQAPAPPPRPSERRRSHGDRAVRIEWRSPNEATVLVDGVDVTRLCTAITTHVEGGSYPTVRIELDPSAVELVFEACAVLFAWPSHRPRPTWR